MSLEKSLYDFIKNQPIKEVPRDYLRQWAKEMHNRDVSTVDRKLRNLTEKKLLEPLNNQRLKLSSKNEYIAYYRIPQKEVKKPSESQNKPNLTNSDKLKEANNKIIKILDKLDTRNAINDMSIYDKIRELENAYKSKYLDVKLRIIKNYK